MLMLCTTHAYPLQVAFSYVFLFLTLIAGSLHTHTHRQIKALFAWPKMKAFVTAFVQSCEVCQQAKSEHVRLPRLLQPLPVPEKAWSVVSLDFIEGLPKSQSYNAILMVVDKFTKYGHFIPLAHPFTALSVAKLYFAHIYKLHGLPDAIISD